MKKFLLSLTLFSGIFQLNAVPSFATLKTELGNKLGQLMQTGGNKLSNLSTDKDLKNKLNSITKSLSNLNKYEFKFNALNTTGLLCLLFSINTCKEHGLTTSQKYKACAAAVTLFTLSYLLSKYH